MFARIQRGFTLIELLVVIAIIAILSGILFPVFAQAREKGRQTVCLSNMKQLGTALAIYRNDYDGRYPGPGTFEDYSTAGPGVLPPYMICPHNTGTSPFRLPNFDPLGQWVPNYSVLKDQSLPYDPVKNPTTVEWQKTGPKYGTLYTYVKNVKVYLCPSDPWPQKLMSYSMNKVAGYIVDGAVQRPAQFIVLVDEQYTLNDALYSAPGDCPSNAHSGGANIAFYDGHVKWSHANQKPAFGNCPTAIRNSYYCPSIPFPYTINGYNNICKTL